MVALPYNTSTMSFFECYTMGIPLFVPTPRFMLELKSQFPRAKRAALAFLCLFVSRKTGNHAGRDTVRQSGQLIRGLCRGATPFPQRLLI